MEFYLIHKGSIYFMSSGPTPTTANQRLVITSLPMKVSVKPVVPHVGSDSKYSKLLETSLGLKCRSGVGVNSFKWQKKAISELTVQLHLNSMETKNDHVLICSGSRSWDRKAVNVLERLRQVFGEENVTLKIIFKGRTFTTETRFNFKADDLQIRKQSMRTNNLSGKEYGCDYGGMKFPRDIYVNLRNGEHVYGKLTVTVTLNHQAVNLLCLEEIDKQSLCDEWKTMLQEEISSDFVIIAGNGAQVKCHKVVLSVKSETFKAMFQSGMVEATKNFIEMPDMTEDAVQAFLAFIYYWDLTEASKSCEIALELFRAGNKYGISTMESAMRGILCAKPNDWFDVDTTMKLLMLAQNLGPWNGNDWLQTKALQVLKEKPKDDLFNSAEFQELYKKHPRKAMEVSAMFLEFS